MKTQPKIFIKKDTLLSVKEVSKITGISERAIQEKVKLFYPERVKNGKPTLLSQEMVTRIKLSYQYSGRNDLANVREVVNVNTDLEMELMAKRVMDWQIKKIKSLFEQNRSQKRKLTLLAHSSHTYSATDIAKELGLGGAKTLHRYLNEKKVLYQDQKGDWQPYYRFSEKGYFCKKQEILENGKIVYYLKFTQKGRDMVLNLFHGDGQ